MEANYNKLQNQVSGNVILPQDENYDEVRKIYNGMIDKKPAVIVQCKNNNDVVEAVNFGRVNNLEVSIRSGGHNGAGLALIDNGLVIDLSEMKSIEIDAASKIAKVQSGNTLGDVDQATHEHGLALPSGIIGTTGIGGITWVVASVI